ncbi:hypothetical protein PG991_000750 [Apiospora marii]|uniref:Secreted protein n=1 Tax=Apiospora marii TaxID=335849 RepID=A0ABR1SSX3_9PEZI
MKFITAILFGAVAFVKAKSTVVTSKDALWNRLLILMLSKVFSPERTGLATASDPKPASQGAIPSDPSIKKHGNAICPAEYAYPANQKYIRDGIKWLRGYKGTCAAPPLPNVVNCQRGSCSWASGIYLCNDSNEKWAEPSCATIADYAQEILNNCKSVALVNDEQLTQGELWDDDGWHIYVGHANC